jgi:hypothetical protein
MEGGGERELSFSGHFEESASTRGLSFASWWAGARREMEETDVIEGRERRVDRMLEPCRID